LEAAETGAAAAGPSPGNDSGMVIRVILSFPSIDCASITSFASVSAPGLSAIGYLAVGPPSAIRACETMSFRVGVKTTL
jgi:hypothetical protein